MFKATKLTSKQQRFCQNYVIDLNATAAAERAGFKVPESQGPRLLGNVLVKAEIDRLKALREIRTEITADQVLEEIAKLAFVNAQDLYDDNGFLRHPKDLPREVAAAISEVETVQRGKRSADGDTAVEIVKKVKLWDKRGSLELLGKHLHLFGDRLKVTDGEGNTLKFIIEE